MIQQFVGIATAACVFFSPAIVVAAYYWAAPRFYDMTQRVHERNRHR